MKIGDECYVHGYVDEIRKDTVIIRNEGGYFGTAKPEVLTVPPEYVLVVRCKDCKFSKAYYHGSESNLGMFTYLCTQGLYGMNAEDYCSRAERKDNETD